MLCGKIELYCSGHRVFRGKKIPQGSSQLLKKAPLPFGSVAEESTAFLHGLFKQDESMLVKASP